MISANTKLQYFYLKDWTAQISLNEHAKFAASRTPFFPAQRRPNTTWRAESQPILPVGRIISARISTKARWDRLEASSRFGFLIEHDLFGKSPHTFPDQALENGSARAQVSPRDLEADRAGGDPPFTKLIVKANGFKAKPNTLVYPVTPLA
jgi:hypothetical protein